MYALIDARRGRWTIVMTRRGRVEARPPGYRQRKPRSQRPQPDRSTVLFTVHVQ